jgi:hypothetical protein
MHRKSVFFVYLAVFGMALGLSVSAVGDKAILLS